MTIYICKPNLRHLFQQFPKDIKHQLHKWTAGVILINHLEPNGLRAADLHRKHIVLKIEVERVINDDSTYRE